MLVFPWETWTAFVHCPIRLRFRRLKRSLDVYVANGFFVPPFTRHEEDVITEQSGYPIKQVSLAMRGRDQTVRNIFAV